jgi:hypothetical protein
MPTTIADPWLGFLAEVDRRLDRPVELHCLGGFVLAVLWGLQRPTGDVDFIECEPSSAVEEVIGIAGEGSELARRFNIHLHRVGVAEYPEAYVSRLSDITPEGFVRLRLMALEVHDVALSKIGRNSPRDRADVEFLARRGALDSNVLAERFEHELRPYALNEDRSKTTLELWIEEFFGPGGRA